MVDLVWLNKASIPNFSFLGSLGVSQRYLPGLVVGVGHHIDYKTLSIVLALNWSTETKLAKKNHG